MEIEIGPENPLEIKNQATREEYLKWYREQQRENQRKWQKEAQERKIEIKMNALKIPKRFKKTYEVKNEQQLRVFQFVQKYIDDIQENMEAGRNLFFIGNMGTGKTHLSYYLGAALVHKGLDVLAVTAAEYIDEIKNTWKKEVKVSSQEVREKYESVDFLILDEIGVIKPDAREQQEFYTLLKKRYDEELPTLFIANIPISNFPDYLAGDRGWDKIREKSHEALFFVWQTLRN